MADHKHYFPILKGKRAEFPALGALQRQKLVTPLLEAIPTKPATMVPKGMCDHWPEDSVYFIDLVFLDDDEGSIADAPQHPVTLCFASDKINAAVPVTALERSDAYQEAVRVVLERRGPAVGIRLSSDEIDERDDLGEDLDELMEFLGVERSDVTLFIDSQAILGISPNRLSQLWLATVQSVPHITEWSQVVIAGAAFPEGLSSLQRGWNRVPRVGWSAWTRLLGNASRVDRLPAFGDYTIANEGLPYDGFGVTLAQLRYATDDSWFTHKGHDVRKHPDRYQQFQTICQDLMTRPQYSGPAFSDGDRMIEEYAATPGPSYGNAEKWRRIGTNHHMELVALQIASLP